MADITPITRDEFYLAKAGGQDVPVPSAVTREEYYLEKLSNDNVDVPTPVTRREKFLYFACGGEIELPSEERMTRLERLIAKAGGMDVSTPTAVTRLEKFWANVEGGGLKTITGVLPLTFTAKGGTAADWVIEGNQQGVGERTENLFDENSEKVSGYINAQGEMLPASHTYTYDYFAVEPSSEYTYKAQSATLADRTIRVAFYTDSKTFISRSLVVNGALNSQTITTPNNCRYVRLSNDYGLLGVMFVKGSILPSEYIPYGYQIPLTVSQQGQIDKTVDIYIGDSPLTEGETVSKTSTGVDIELFEGENTVSTTLYNKPAMEIKYK